MSVTDAAQAAWATVAELDPEVWSAMRGEADRQRWKIELIASENYTFAAVMEAQGSWLTNKYAEGLPGKRYYGGYEYVDAVVALAGQTFRVLVGEPGPLGLHHRRERVVLARDQLDLPALSLIHISEPTR